MNMTLGNYRDTSLFIIDGHADVPNPLVVDTQGTIDEGTAIDVDLLRAGTVAAVILAANVVPGEGGAGVASDLAIIDAKIDAIKQICATKPDKVALALSSDELVRIAGEGKTAIMIELLGTHALGTDLAAIERFTATAFACWASPTLATTRLPTRPGRFSASAPISMAVCRRWARPRLRRPMTWACCSMYRTCPVTRFFSGAQGQPRAGDSVPLRVRALVDNPRNLSDEELTAIAQAGRRRHGCVRPLSAQPEPG